MARRSRRRTSRQSAGGPFYRPNRERLPRAGLYDDRPSDRRAVTALARASVLSLTRFSPVIHLPPKAVRSYGRTAVRGTIAASLRSLTMRAPARVRFCLRRKKRREVLFAKGRVGFSGSSPKPRYRRTQESQYAC